MLDECQAAPVAGCTPGHAPHEAEYIVRAPLVVHAHEIAVDPVVGAPKSDTEAIVELKSKYPWAAIHFERPVNAEVDRKLKTSPAWAGKCVA